MASRAATMRKAKRKRKDDEDCRRGDVDEQSEGGGHKRLRRKTGRREEGWWLPNAEAARGSSRGGVFERVKREWLERKRVRAAKEQ